MVAVNCAFPLIGTVTVAGAIDTDLILVEPLPLPPPHPASQRTPAAKITEAGIRRTPNLPPTALRIRGATSLLNGLLRIALSISAGFLLVIARFSPWVPEAQAYFCEANLKFPNIFGGALGPVA